MKMRQLVCTTFVPKLCAGFYVCLVFVLVRFCYPDAATKTQIYKELGWRMLERRHQRPLGGNVHHHQVALHLLSLLRVQVCLPHCEQSICNALILVMKNVKLMMFSQVKHVDNTYTFQ